MDITLIRCLQHIQHFRFSSINQPFEIFSKDEGEIKEIAKRFQDFLKTSDLHLLCITYYHYDSQWLQFGPS